MALRVICDICQRTMPNASLSAQDHFCDRCKEFGQDYRVGVERITAEGFATITKQIERFRASFLADKVLKRKAS